MQTKLMKIDGMTCPHCGHRVECALNALDGVKARVDANGKGATIVLAHPVDDIVLMKAVLDAGYQPRGIKNE